MTGVQLCEAGGQRAEVRTGLFLNARGNRESIATFSHSYVQAEKQPLCQCQEDAWLFPFLSARLPSCSSSHKQGTLVDKKPGKVLYPASVFLGAFMPA